ncbi:hypothetical protein NDU88_004596 [Pleurodeles waltl]|uniref:Secreted protein n=1 Tax=Pleurodeles waltl TaxID=8319 RepID=A0AAV7N1W7_PLEWA|nr:hypothetical protein NDU88_004596 [Pleurodeles waltl]
MRGRAPWPLLGRAIVAAKVVPLQRLMGLPGCGCRRSEDRALTGDAGGFRKMCDAQCCELELPGRRLGESLLLRVLLLLF